MGGKGCRGGRTPSEGMKEWGKTSLLVRSRICKRTEDRTFILVEQGTQDSFSDEAVRVRTPVLVKSRACMWGVWGCCES